MNLPPFKPAHLVPIVIGIVLTVAAILLFPDLFRI